MFGAFFGATTAVLLRAWANGLGKQRYFARPWNHALVAVAGGYIGHNYFTWEKQLLEKLNDKRKEKGLAAITREDLSVFNK